MLIIAIPKSASTSLLYTMRDSLNFPAKQKFDHKKKSSLYPVLTSLHSDVGEYSRIDVDEFTHPYKIFKQHIPPTKNNIDLLKKQKKVILLRDVDEIILAYKRGAKAEVHNLLKGFEKSWSDKKWLSMSKENSLYYELNNFSNKWKEEEGSYTLIIYYKDLIDDPTLVINKILEFVDYPKQINSLNLAKARYSKVSAIRIYLRKIRKRLNV
jgi:hypothetical protein